MTLEPGLSQPEAAAAIPSKKLKVQSGRNEETIKTKRFKDAPRHGMNSVIPLHTSSVAIRAKYRERFSNDCPSNHNTSKRRDRNSCQFPTTCVGKIACARCD